ncbi:hypothetical protein HHL23_09260 [Chryseobacterium sp. RP-3-3]|uniref:Uncharacterized protein n=1 Tax=Chryseobacterium antibioticum TaxID=2728847 RepID=A0A7Y0FR96_9FLAO|nr:hypothetical protein [Chryseobacterium antibioticum]NML69987.1 hypothetical protein [Chryseobacterium antibioticum]
MSRIQEIREVVAEKFEFVDWNDLRSFHILNDVPGLEEIENDVIATYTEECIKASLLKASNGKSFYKINDCCERVYGVKKEHIIDPDNIVLL